MDDIRIIFSDIESKDSGIDTMFHMLAVIMA